MHPEYADLLVECGIDAISVNIDVIDRARSLVAAAERRVLLRARARGLTAMFEVRIHGRGGQGVVTGRGAARRSPRSTTGLQAQAFPSFGSERMGAPVTAFCRIDETPIRRREPIAEPDAVVVQDPTLLHHVDVFGGLGAEGYVLINSSRSIRELGLDELFERHARQRVHDGAGGRDRARAARPADPERRAARRRSSR